MMLIEGVVSFIRTNNCTLSRGKIRAKFGDIWCRKFEFMRWTAELRLSFKLHIIGRPVMRSVRPSIDMTTKHRIYTTSVASVYPLYVAKAERKGRKKSEVDAVICWLTGYNQRELERQLKEGTDFETFFKEAPKLNPSRNLIKGVICGVRVEDIQDPTMREIRYLDKLVDELAKGKSMDKILRA